MVGLKTKGLFQKEPKGPRFQVIRGSLIRPGNLALRNEGRRQPLYRFPTPNVQMSAHGWVTF